MAEAAKAEAVKSVEIEEMTAVRMAYLLTYLLAVGPSVPFRRVCSRGDPAGRGTAGVEMLVAFFSERAGLVSRASCCGCCCCCCC